MIHRTIQEIIRMTNGMKIKSDNESDRVKVLVPEKRSPSVDLLIDY